MKVGTADRPQRTLKSKESHERDENRGFAGTVGANQEGKWIEIDFCNILTKALKVREPQFGELHFVLPLTKLG